MRNESTAIIERDGEWYVAYRPEIRGANGQGKSKGEARENLAEAIALILQDRRQEGLRGEPPDAMCETVTVKRAGNWKPEMEIPVQHLPGDLTGLRPPTSRASRRDPGRNQSNLPAGRNPDGGLTR